MSRAAEPGSFVYVAMRAQGGRRVGVRQARSRRALSESLRRERMLLLKSWEVPGWAAPGGGSELALKDHAVLNDQLAQLLGRGVPLVEALEVTASAVRGGAKGKIERMRELVAAGSSFSDACANVGGFDAVTVAVYRGAERTGDLAGAAAQLSKTVRRRLAVSGKALTLMMYPAIVLTISLAVAVLMLMFIVPRIGEALAEADMKLPVYSQIVMGAGAWMRAHATWLAVGAAGVLAAALVLHKAVARGAARVMRSAPALKDVVLAQESARFFSVMGALVKSGVPLADALGVANGAVNHPALRKQLERLRTRLIEGGILKNLIEEVTRLPLATRRLLIAAERSGDMESAFNTLADDLTNEVDKRSERLLAALQPLLVVLMFLIIGSLLIAILVPMLSLSGQTPG